MFSLTRGVAMQTIIFGVSGIAEMVLDEMGANRNSYVFSGEVPVDGGTGEFELPCWTFMMDKHDMTTVGSKVQTRIPISDGFEAMFLVPTDHKGRVLPQCAWGEDEITTHCEVVKNRINAGTISKWFC
jgi:hypothetical protein